MAAPRLDLGAISVGGEPVCYTLCGSHVTFVVRDFCQSAPLIPVGLLSGGLLLLRRPAASPGPGARGGERSPLERLLPRTWRTVYRIKVR